MIGNKAFLSCQNVDFNFKTRDDIVFDCCLKHKQCVVGTLWKEIFIWIGQNMMRE